MLFKFLTDFFPVDMLAKAAVMSFLISIKNICLQ